jgi:hypothetical protein
MRLAHLMSGSLLAAALALVVAPAAGAPRYPWTAPGDTRADTLAQRVAPPAGFERVTALDGSFAQWLRGLPMKPSNAPVKLYTGVDKFRQDAHVAVVEIDTGSKDLQQCADAVMRLRAEWQLATGRSGEIGFNYTGGGRVSFARWSRGERPSSDGRTWLTKAKADSSYASFRRYLEQVFAYAGTYSLERELKAVPLQDMQIGDVFIKGGFPGHAVLVADLVENKVTGERRFLLLQSYMPAQDIHLLKNPGTADGSPWYPAVFRGSLVTPEWTFPAGSLKGWR